MKEARHGGPYDRGAADSYYRRPFRPHYYSGPTYNSDVITNLTEEEIAEYTKGFNDNEEDGDHKDWGFDY